MSQPTAVYDVEIDEVSYGYCHCGCGNKTNIAKQNDKRRGHIKGQPVKFCHGHFPSRTLSPEQRIILFWSRVNKDGSIPMHMPHLGKCWEWTGNLGNGGYADFNISEHKKTKVHRYSWIMANGDIPDGLFVLHKCDNRKCVNPDHLFLGTNQDNMDDRNTKGRQAKLRGELNGICRLTNQDIKNIREQYDNGEITQAELAREYSVTPQHIWQIVHRTQWKHI